ncbi:GumC family protein [Pelagibacterium lacus]|uniref:Polysaccharide chain length determinant N-terminal domain-containing protein n=1 Tax=Pelagibacterium lacus TaxID=2282655 RepID=A0A369W4A5_9HYPH|nr:Wzz/FepE/Etk N-terminal domain-containing protein [Pelagibacterium lacus]RDE09153.1 hypothetical protein DVH29_08155 [Pelagibacterium lacus]
MEDAEVDIRGIVALLRRQLGLIVVVFVVVLGVALVVTLALPQRYTATALVIVDTTAKNLLDPEGSVVSAAGDTARVTSEVEIILSPAILAQVVDAMGLRWDPEFGSSGTLMDPVWRWLHIGPSSAEEPLSRVLGRFRNALSVERRGQTYVIAIAVESQDARKSAELANAMADAYVGQQVQSKISSIAASQAVLDARISNARATLLAAEQALGRFLAEEANAGQTRDDLSVERLTRLSELEQSVGLARSQHSTLLARSSELGMQADLQIADSRIVSRALPNHAPSFPNRRMILAMAGLAGLGLGIALAFLREHFIGGITTEGQAVSVLRLPVIAEIPRQRGLAGNEAMSVADSVMTVPLSPYSEAVRRMKAGIDRHLSQRMAGSTADGRGTVIVFSSSVPLEGKTTLALSLARSYALAGRKTLMIDCDLRAPSVHRHLGSDPRYGLLDYLTGLRRLPA